MPFWKNPSRRLLSAGDEARVVEAIRAAERETSGEIRVHVDECCNGDPIEQARICFAALGMTATAARNGALVYFAVDDRRFAVIGDVGLHAVVDPTLWDTLRDRLAVRLSEGNAGAGIVEAVTAIGGAMAGAFPRDPDDRNELPDEVSWGPSGSRDL